MDLKRHFLEAATLIAAAVLCALVANAVAGHERKVALVGAYPNATKVPAATPDVQPIVTQTQPPTQTATVVVPPVVPTATVATATTATIANNKHPLNPAAQQPSTPATQTTPATGNRQPATNLTAKFPPHPDKPYVEIHGDDVAALHQAGVLFLDARRTNVYEQGHIAGARPFSVWESDVADKVNALFNERGDGPQASQPIVVYCSGGDCEDSHMLAERLAGAFPNVYVYKDGFPDWQKRGGSVHTGANP